MSKKQDKRDTPPAENLLAGAPERTEEGLLTHKGMRQVMARGGTVVHKGVHLTSIDQLPDQIKLEGHNAEALDSLEEDLDVEQTKLDAKRKRIEKRRKKLAASPDDESEETEETDEEDSDEAIEDLSKGDLLEIAKKKKIEGASEMTKDELVKAIKKAG